MSDELIYRVKFEADPKSLAELQKAIKDIEKEGASSSSRKSLGVSGSTDEEIEKEINALKELNQELKKKRVELSNLNKVTEENNGATNEQAQAQRALGIEIQSISQRIQEANRGYADQATILQSTPQTLNELIEKQRALKIAASDVDFNSQQFIDLSREYAEVGKRINELTATMKGGANEIRQYGTTLADLKAEQKMLATAIENTPIEEQEDRLKDLQKQYADVTKRIDDFRASMKPVTQDVVKQGTTISALKTELSKKREELAKLNQEARNNGDVSDAMRAKQAELGLQIQTISQQLQESNRGYSDQATILAQMPSTYNELVEQNRALSIAMKNVPLDDTSGELQNLKKRYAENNVKLKEFDATVGNHQRNVGDYENSLRAVANAVATIQGPLGPVAGRINSFATVLSRMSNKSKETTTTLQLLRTALVALPIIAITSALTALMQFFTKSERGQEKFRIIMAQINAVMNVLRERAIAVGETLAKLWDDPARVIDIFKSRVTGLGSAIVDSLVTRVKAIPQVYVGIFDQIIGSFQFLGAKVRSALAGVPIIGEGIDAEQAEKDAEEAGLRVINGLLKTKDALATIYNVDFLIDGANSFAKSISDIVEEAKEEFKISGNLQERLERELNIRRDLAVERAKQQKDLQQAKRDAKERNLTLDERIKRLQEIEKAESSLFAKELANEEEILRLMKEQAKLAENSEEENQALADQEIKVAEIQKQNQEREMSALESINELRSKQLELIGAAARKQFETTIGFGELALNARIHQLEREGRLVEAAQERISAIQMTFGDRVASYMAEMRTLRFNEQFTQEEMFAMAIAKARLDIATETQDAILGMEEKGMEERIMRAQALSNAMGAVNQTLFNDSKALATAQTIVDTYAAAVGAMKDTKGPIYVRLAAAAAAVSAGIASLRRIHSTKLGSKGISSSVSGSAQTPNVGTSFGLVDVGTNTQLASQVAMEATSFRQEMNPTFIFQGDLDPEIMAIKVNQGSNAISSRTLGVGI